MTAPNLKDPTTITGKTVGYAVTNTLTSALENTTGSNKVLKINSVYCANVDGTNSADITLTHYNGSLDFRIGYAISVPPDATQMLVARDAYIYLEEGQSLKAQSSFNNRLELIIGYEDIS